MKWFALVAIAAVAACGSLPDAGGGVVGLQVLVPVPDSLVVDSSQTLHARALNLQGDSVAAEIFWRTLDTALVTLDTARGVIVARTNTGVARVQARTGTLVSDIVLITLRDPPTSLRARP